MDSNDDPGGVEVIPQSTNKYSALKSEATMENWTFVSPSYVVTSCSGL